MDPTGCPTVPETESDGHDRNALIRVYQECPSSVTSTPLLDAIAQPAKYPTDSHEPAFVAIAWRSIRGLTRHVSFSANMANSARTFGTHVRETRLERASSLRSVARALGITPSYLSDIENDRRLPAETVIQGLAAHLGLDFADLMDLAGRLGETAERYLKAEPAATALLRRISEKRLEPAQLAQLSAIVDGIQGQAPSRNRPRRPFPGDALARESRVVGGSRGQR